MKNFIINLKPQLKFGKSYIVDIKTAKYIKEHSRLVLSCGLIDEESEEEIVDSFSFSTKIGSLEYLSTFIRTIFGSDVDVISPNELVGVQFYGHINKCIGKDYMGYDVIYKNLVADSEAFEMEE